MDLPAELRLDIYEYILVSDEPISFGNRSAFLHPPMTSPAITNPLWRYLPLTQASRQIRDETTPLLYGKNTFNVLLRSVKTVEKLLPKPTRPKWSSTEEEHPLFDHVASSDPGCLLYGDQHAAAWACVARPEAVAHVQRLTVTIEKAHRIAEWRHWPQLYLTPSNNSLEQTAVFSARRWHFHAIELRCPGLDTAVWTLDCRENQTGDRRPRWRTLGSGSQGQFEGESQACGRCSLMLNNWRIARVKNGDMSKELFLALTWYESTVVEAPLQ
jgi:hypothetical protein